MTTLTLAEKQAKAQALLAECKAAARIGGGVDGADYAAHVEKMTEARTLMTEVKAEKTEREQKELLGLIESFEKSLASDPDEEGTVTAAKSRLAEIDEHKAKKDAFNEDFGAIRRAKLMIENDVRGNQLMKAYRPETYEKAMVEGTASAGGYLVVPQYFQDMFAAVRRQGNALRRYGWLNTHPTTSNAIIIPRGGGATTVGWTAEGATKPTSDLSFTQITLNVFTLAGLGYASLQLLRDSDPGVAEMVIQDMSLMLGNAEEVALINGSGSGVPRGILNTVGINDHTTAITASPTGQSVIDAIIDGVADIQQNYFAPPSGILMRPKRLAFLQKSKDTATNYLFNAPGAFRAPGGLSAGLTVTSASEGTTAGLPELFGLPIGVSQNIPNNLTYGSGTGEDAIIVGAWNELHWFERQEITVDQTTQGAGTFESNTIAFRLEERATGTAARYPGAFSVISGVGLVGA